MTTNDSSRVLVPATDGWQATNTWRRKLHTEYHQHEQDLYLYVRPWNDDRPVRDVQTFQVAASRVAQTGRPIPDRVMRLLDSAIQKRRRVRRSFLAELRDNRNDPNAPPQRTSISQQIDRGHAHQIQQLNRVRVVWTEVNRNLANVTHTPATSEMTMDTTVDTIPTHFPPAPPELNCAIQSEISPDTRLEDIDQLSVIINFLSTVQDVLALVETQYAKMIYGQINLVAFGSQLSMAYWHVCEEVDALLQDDEHRNIVDSLIPARLSNQLQHTARGQTLNILNTVLDWGRVHRKLDEVEQQLSEHPDAQTGQSPAWFALVQASQIYRSMFLFKESKYHKYRSPILRDLHHTIDGTKVVPRIVLLTGVAIMSTMEGAAESHPDHDFALATGLLSVQMDFQKGRRDVIDGLRTELSASVLNSFWANFDNAMSAVNDILDKLRCNDLWTVSHIFLANLKDNHEVLFRVFYDPVVEGSILQFIVALRNIEFVGGRIHDKIIHKFVDLMFRTFCSCLSVPVPHSLPKLVEFWREIIRQPSRTRSQQARRSQRQSYQKTMAERMRDPRFGFHAAFVINDYQITPEELTKFALHLGVAAPQSLRDKLDLVQKADTEQRMMYVSAEVFGHQCRRFVNELQRDTNLRFRRGNLAFTPLQPDPAHPVTITPAPRNAELVGDTTRRVREFHRGVLRWPEGRVSSTSKMLCAMPWVWTKSWDDVLSHLLPDLLAAQFITNPNLSQNVLWSQISIETIDNKFGSTAYDEYCHEDDNTWLMPWRDHATNGGQDPLGLGHLYFNDFRSSQREDQNAPVRLKQRWRLIGHAFRKKVGLFDTNVHSLVYFDWSFRQSSQPGFQWVRAIMI